MKQEDLVDSITARELGDYLLEIKAKKHEIKEIADAIGLSARTLTGYKMAAEERRRNREGNNKVT